MSPWSNHGVTWRFQHTNTLKQRQAIFAKLVGTYNDRVPVIVQVGAGATVELKREKYLAPGSTTVGKFMSELRKQAGDSIEPTQALFLLMGDTQALAPSGMTMQELWERHRNEEDNLLYVQLLMENTFGCEDM